MAETFYTLLGVGPDANEERIETAYRERVKECHPDQNPDAENESRREIQRLTIARETLVDAAERSTYDRLGHTDYVSRHVDSSTWTASSSEWTAAGMTDDDAGVRSSKQCSDSSSEDGVSRIYSPPPGATSTSPWTGFDTDGDDGSRTVDGRTDSASGSRETATATARTNGGTGHATTTAGSACTASPGRGASFWDAHEPGTDRTSATGRAQRRTPTRFVDGMRKLGAWLLLDLLFVAIAVGLGAYVLTTAPAARTGTPSITTVSLVVVELLVVTALVTLHLVSKLYR